MAKSDSKKISMVSVISEVLKIKKENKGITNEEVMRLLEDFIHRTKDKSSRLMMVVVASKTLDLMDRNPKMNDKEIMKNVIKDFDSLIKGAEED